MKKIFTLIAVMATMLTATAQDETYSYTILHEVDTLVKAKLNSISFGSRDVHHIIYEFPSTDTDKKPVTISGIVMAPKDIVDGNVPCDGIILLNHHTIGSPEDAPSQGGLDVPSAMLACPLKPNYIIVMCDYIGYGSSIDHPIAYLCGDTNARNSLDGLLAARQMLKDKNIPLGKYQFNMGYSQGGSESMYVAKLRDMEYKNKGITFDKTFAGGGVMDCEKAYTELVKRYDWDSLKDVAMMIVSVNENYHMNLDYQKIFKEPLASSIPKMLETKSKGDMNMEGIDSLHQMLQPEYLTPESEEFQALKAKLAEIKITNGWVPDTTQNYYYEHSRHDNYVPVQAGRSIITWMKEQGYKASLVPGKTRLQTCMLVFKLKHQAAAIPWVIQTMAAIQYWPTIYYNDEQNTYYHDVVKDLNLMKTVKYLESFGLDLRKMVASNAPLYASLQQEVENGTLDPESSVSEVAMRRADFFTQLTEVLDKLGLTLSDALEMLDDSGITLADILQVYMYVTTPATASDENFEALSEKVEAPLFLLHHYEQTMANWFLLGGYDSNYEQWGW